MGRERAWESRYGVVGRRACSLSVQQAVNIGVVEKTRFLALAMVRCTKTIHRAIFSFFSGENCCWWHFSASPSRAAMGHPHHTCPYFQ